MDKNRLTGKVLIAAPVHNVLLQGLATHGYECMTHERITQHTAFDLVRDCVGIITSTRLQLNRTLIDQAPLLQWIGRMGSGMEVIDVEYATKKGIACFSSPEGNSNAVAEHALGMLLSVMRRIVVGHNELKQGVWLREENRGTELENKTVGIIGFGHTGAAFAKKLQAFDVRILAYDKYDASRILPYVTNCDTLDLIFDQADVISFHVPLQQDTVHYFNEAFMNSMRKRFIVINTSRGVVVDTVSLHKGLASGKISGACLDVFEHEPIGAASAEMLLSLKEIIAMPNVVATPHIAGYTFEAVYKMSLALLHKISAYISA